MQEDIIPHIVIAENNVHKEKAFFSDKKKKDKLCEVDM